MITWIYEIKKIIHDTILLNLITSIFRCIISPLTLTNKIEIKKKKKEKVIINNGNNIDESIEGEENLDMLAGWWRVLHQSTDHLIIGRFIIPIIAKIDEYLSALDLSS